MTRHSNVPGPWFPLFQNQIEDPYFKGLTPREKVLFWYLASEFNHLGKFYRADVDLAAAVGLSVPKVRQARRKLEGMALVAVEPGFKTRDGKGIDYIQRRMGGAHGPWRARRFIRAASPPRLRGPAE